MLVLESKSDEDVKKSKELPDNQDLQLLLQAERDGTNMCMLGFFEIDSKPTVLDVRD